MLSTPILFLIFNRPETTERVFKEIRKQKPKYLFVAADGPRTNLPGEKEKCKKARDIVMNAIDWDCELKILFRDHNLGCRLAVSEAVTWFFNYVEEGIILEDDTLPDASFFIFCEQLLDKYRLNERIKIISGINFQDGIKRGDASYYFSGICHIWGWASWRRTWNEYDLNLSSINKNEVASMVFDYFRDTRVVSEWENIYKKLLNNELDTWDFQLAFSIWKKGGLNIVPQKNLVTNIGYGKDATNTTQSSDLFSNIPVKNMGEIKFANEIKIHLEADTYTLKKIFPVYKKSFRSIAKSFLRRIKLK